MRDGFSFSFSNGTVFAFLKSRPQEPGQTTLREILPANHWGDLAETAPQDTGGVECSARCYSQAWPWFSRRQSE